MRVPKNVRTQHGLGRHHVSFYPKPKPGGATPSILGYVGWMNDLPAEATFVDPRLREVGADVLYQETVYAKIDPTKNTALVVARLIAAHPLDARAPVGSYFGCRLHGVATDEFFMAWAITPVGEVAWVGRSWEPLIPE